MYHDVSHLRLHSVNYGCKQRLKFSEQYITQLTYNVDYDDYNAYSNYASVIP